jgi:hypothetical protein
LLFGRQHRHGRGLGVRWQESADVHHSAERDVSQIRRRAVITHNSIGQQGEGLRIVSVELARSFDTYAATAVCMVHEDQFAPIGVCFF